MNKTYFIVGIVFICSVSIALFMCHQTYLSIPDPNNNMHVSEKLAKEIDFYKTGKMKTNTIRYQLFLLCASQVVSYHRFYKELSIQQIVDYFQAVQVFSSYEITIIVQELIAKAGNSDDADSLLRKTLPILLCPYKKFKQGNEFYISPCCCKKLYESIIKKTYQTSWGIYSPGYLFDFKSSQMKEMRKFQEAHSSKPKYQHSIDTCLVIYQNSFSKIYDQPIKKKEKPLFFEKVPSKPTINWEKNIHIAATKGNIKSLQYNIYLLPLLRDLMDENGNTPVHLASINGDVKSITALKDMNADLNLYNNKGNLPIHIVKTKAALETFISAGCDINILNKKGETIIEIQSNPFNKDVIEGLINRGVNILLPNKKGIYWMQYVIHNHYFPANKNEYIEFQKFVRKILSKNQFDFYLNNFCLRHILVEDVYKSEKNDTEYLRKAVNNGDMDKIITYLGMGTPPDTKISSTTNLLIVSENGDTELVKIFANNYCNPNNVNEKGENAFWLAASNRYYDVSTLLYKNYSANPNILSKTGETLLHISYAQKNNELFNYLLKIGASPNVKNNNYQSVQFISFLKRDDKIAEMIQDKYKGDINSGDKDGNTLGHLSILQYDNQRLEYLIDRGLNIERKNDLGYSLFMCALINVGDLVLCQNLLYKGANINTQDRKGRTPFYNVCKDDHFSRKKFDFLLQNYCNFSIQDYNRDFPISQLIKNERKEEALILLNKNANIIDPNSPTEPICVAINEKNEYWINTLIRHGANAKNKQFPVIEKYIKLDFFDFNTLKKMSPLNVAVGAPIQAAIRKKLISVAHYLWDKANTKTKIKISHSRDDKNRVPISVAILADDEYLVNQLIQFGYDLSTADNIGRTPYMYACIKNRPIWMANIEQYISIHDLNAVDYQGNSALTFVANNGQNSIADHLFIKGVNINGINYDNYGIIKRYVWIMEKYEQILNRALNNRDNYKDHFENINHKLEKCQENIKEIRHSLNSYQNLRNQADPDDGSARQYDSQIRKLKNDLEREKYNFDQLKIQKANAKALYNGWSRNYEEINIASRETILYHLDDLDHLSKYVSSNHQGEL